MTEMFGEAWPPMSVPDLAPDDDDDDDNDDCTLKWLDNFLYLLINLFRYSFFKEIKL